MANSTQLSQQTQTVGIRVPVGHIVANGRWSGSAIVADLQAALPVHFETCNTSSAIDFFPSCHTGVVFLTESDIVEGKTYKRKVARLRKANKVKGIVIVEKTQTSGQYYKDVQKFCVADLGLDCIPVGSQSEAASFLVQMVYAESKLDNNPFLKPVQSPAFDPCILAALTSCPGIGETKALELLHNFKSLEGLCKASQEDIAALIGNAKAQKLHHFFHGIT